ncbi:hypothetical protein CYVG_00052 [Cyanophage S-SSM6a]|uniref:Uncharacterized protein n=1 Tax=Synechococcus phage S-SSM7 TaxID=445686 RepID=E3SLA0_9CAUD|nr:hypothetical protein SSSM7_183 [Synechococcus phage S-SSM7]ADO98248.1 hypothetical protein SSSM7_183 [Synechococcus phage S-SSM7]AGH07496.1 hypothetical protein CYVG_00052 [Cyanophage S-SSM6a]|tara:strand:- start:693 stop:953 length:261 start_codon:yes stop_codon:yes gene_type:complete
MEQEVKILVLVSGDVLISGVEEVAAVDIGDPNCKLVSPYQLDGEEMSPWLKKVTDDVEIMICSDKIVTLVEPHRELIDSYLKLATA